MATDLTNVAVSTGYVQLLHIDGGVGGSATRVYDGDGTGTPLEISTTEVVIKDGSFNLNVASHDGTNGLKLGGTLVTASAAELNLLDGITAGTVSASKFLLVDSNKDLSGLRNLTATGTIQAANFTGTGNTQIGDAVADTVAMNATITTNLVFEGSTANAYETTLAITDPTADRTWTIPDATDTSVGRATTDTLTNKTLTAPDINTPDIDGGTVDAITSLTVANNVDIGSYDLRAGTLTADGLTSGRVVFAGTNGVLSDDSDVSFSGATLSATNLTSSGTVTYGSLSDGSITITAFVDEDGMDSNSATLVPTQQSVKAYVDAQVTAQDLDLTTDSGTIAIDLDSETLTLTGGTGVDTSASSNTVTFALDLNELTTETTIADADFIAMVDATDDGSGKITFENLEDAIFSSVSGDVLITEAGVATIQANSVALGTDTTGNYVATIADSGGGGITVANSGSESAAVTLELDIKGLTDDAIASGDFIAFSDEGESGDPANRGQIDDVATLFAGTGLTASSSVISIDAAQTVINSLLATDIKIGEDDQTKIDFEDADKINFYAGNEKQLILEDGALYPGSNNIIDLGKSDNEFKNAFFDGTVTADAFAGPLTGAVTGNADTATLATTTTVTDSTANTNFPVVFHNESNGLLDDTGALRYNPSTGELLVPKLTVAGTTTTADTVTMEAANAIIFEGATADAHETTLSIVDPTADHTQYLINQGGYIPVLAAATTTAITSTPAELNILDDATVTTAELNLIDGGTARGTTAVASGDGILINDGGTMRMTNVDTVSTYFSSHNVGGGNIVTTGALNSGSITSGFGSIDTGSSTITTTGVVSAGGFTIGSAVIAEAELEMIDGITAGTAAASKAVVLDGSKNIATLGTIGSGAITATGTSSFATAIQTPLIEYTDGDDAITIADGGGITAAAGITSTAASNSFGATAFSGAVTTNSTIDGIDIATRDGVLTSTTTTANAALPKAGGAMTGTITNFTSTGIDDNADATAITIDSSERVGIGISSSITDPLHVKTTAVETRISLESSTGKWAIGAEDGDKFGILNYGTSTPFLIASGGDVTMKRDVIIGDGGEFDRQIRFDGNAQDFHIGLDDSTDKLTIGRGATLGTTAFITIDENGMVTLPDNHMTISDSGNGDTLTLISTDADANTGPNMEFYRNSSSPANNDYLGRVRYTGRNNNSQDVNYVVIDTQAITVTDGAEDGAWNLQAMKGGALNQRIRVNSTETVINDDHANVNFRVESDAVTNALFVKGSDGNVGIGTDSPTAFYPCLQVEGTQPAVILNDNATDGFISMIADNADGAIMFDHSGVLLFRHATNNGGSNASTVFELSSSEAIFNAGNVGIGGSPSGSTLHLFGTWSSTSDWGITLKSTVGNGTAYLQQFRDGSNDLCGNITIATSDQTCAYTSGSDYRIKTNVEEMTGSIERLEQLKPYKYNAKKNAEGRKLDGFYAHELAEIIPEAVVGEKDAVDEDGEIIIQGVDYGRITPLLVSALQEAIERIKVLENV